MEDVEDEESGDEERAQMRGRGERAAEGAGAQDDGTFDMGVALVCEFHAQTGALLLAWANGSVRLLDVTDGSVVDEIKEDRRCDLGVTMLLSPWVLLNASTLACLAESLPTRHLF